MRTLKITMKITTMLLSLSLSLLSAKAFAVACMPVSVNSGFGAGSLPSLASTGCSPITFSDNLHGITVPFAVTIKSNVELDGADRISISPANAAQAGAILQFNTSGSTMHNITVSHPGGLAISIQGNGVSITESDIINSDVGIKVLGSHSDLISNNHFEGITQNAILLVNGNNSLISPSRFSATMNGDDTWTITGTVAAATTAIEIYAADDDNVGIPQGFTFLSNDASFENNTFTTTLSFAITSPDTPLTLLAFDANNNTSAFSPVFTPVDQADFFPVEQQACANVGWFLNDGFDGDSDGDGLSNGDEDVNRNCVHDAGETFANANDTDGDRVLDGVDNCPAQINVNQVDADGDHIGDDCDPEILVPDVAPPVPPEEPPPPVPPLSDFDGDGISDGNDNCKFIANTHQENADGDSLGDACDPTPSISKGNGGGCQLTAASTSSTAVSQIFFALIAFGGMLLAKLKSENNHV